MKQLRAKWCTAALAVCTAAPVAAQWRTQKQTDPINDNVKLITSVRSAPAAVLRGTVATLFVSARSDAGDDPPAIAVRAPGYVFACYPRCELTVRADHAPARGVMSVHASNGVRDTVFLGGETLLLEELAKTKTLLVQVPIHGVGDVVFRFNVTGFKPPTFAPLQ